jgi:hypothetical protein
MSFLPNVTENKVHHSNAITDKKRLLLSSARPNTMNSKSGV